MTSLGLMETEERRKYLVYWVCRGGSWKLRDGEGKDGDKMEECLKPSPNPNPKLNVGLGLSIQLKLKGSQ